MTKDKSINDFNFHQKVNFDAKKVQKEMTSTPKTHNDLKRFAQMVSFFFSSSITFICIFVSNKYHEETEKLHKLNDIFKNKNAKVAIGQKEGEKIAKKISKHMDASDSSDEEEIRYRPPAVEMSN